MTLIDTVAWFFGGMLLANAIPHTVAGFQGKALQSPFAKPPGKGLSSSTVNVVWGLANIAAGWALLTQVGAFDGGAAAHVGTVLAGALVTGLVLARVFGRLHGGTMEDGR